MSTEAHSGIDTHDMVVVHRMFRRESRLLIELIACVAPGDRQRARVLAGHLRDYLHALRTHHTAEDELIWPTLLPRLDSGVETVLRMEAEHARLARTIDHITSLIDGWAATAGGDQRDALVAALVDHRAVLVEHLDDEETGLLPLASQHLTLAEWEAQGGHVAENTPPEKALLFLGMALEDANPAERAQILSTVPEPAHSLWYVDGRDQYERYVRAVRGPRR
jgi:hemerythrin-like domain-containing protein